MDIANMSSMNGANSYTSRLFQDTLHLQKELMSTLNSNINELTARNNAMMQAGKGNAINITV